MERQLILEILITKDYLWDIIDNFIYLNPDKALQYYDTIHLIYQKTNMEYSSANNIDIPWYVRAIQIITPIITMIRLISYIQRDRMLNSHKLLLSYYVKFGNFYGNIKNLEHVIKEDNSWAKVQGNIINILAFLYSYKDKIYVSQEFTNTFANNVADYICMEIADGNCSQEFIFYINTFLA